MRIKIIHGIWIKNEKEGGNKRQRRRQSSSEETAPDDNPFLTTDVERELKETFQKGISVRLKCKGIHSIDYCNYGTDPLFK